ncbi:hypothetical protein ACFVWY_22940 [Streptomyces sp. NPDC058195]|uniref:hypothetical protein n=1 Tax=Streptomyces sp. NPDC058195 TaxID=3346375 RepID=UPI0036EBA808
MDDRGRGWYEGWDDDGDYEKVVERAELVTRVGWSAIAGVAGLLVFAVVAAVLIGLLVLLAFACTLAWQS